MTGQPSKPSKLASEIVACIVRNALCPGVTLLDGTKISLEEWVQRKLDDALEGMRRREC